MNQIRIREFEKLEYRDPRPFLVKLRLLQEVVVNSETPEVVKNLRTNTLKRIRELRDTTIFTYGLSNIIGQTVFLAEREAQDYDFVTRTINDRSIFYTPLQLKEVPPDQLNQKSSVQSVVDSLTKYGDSDDLVVAIKVNRPIHFDPAAIIIPHLRIGGLWVFSALAEDQSEWGLWGDFLRDQIGMRFAYPT